MAPRTGPSPADILLNENAILAARSHRILQSLLGPPPTGTPAETADEAAADEAEVFKPEPDERMGVGFLTGEQGAPGPGRHASKSRRADEKLRKDMLGQHAHRQVAGVTSRAQMGSTSPASVAVPSKPRPPTTHPHAASDEDEGRSSLGKTKRRKTALTMSADGHEARAIDGATGAPPERAPASATTLGAAQTPPRPRSYLDEILLERATKKRHRTGGEARRS